MRATWIAPHARRFFEAKKIFCHSTSAEIVQPCIWTLRSFNAPPSKRGASTLSFPEAVGELLRAGVESYHVDYLGLTKTFHGADGTVATVPLTIENLPAIARDFDAATVRAAILDSQRNGQTFCDFSRRVMQAGVLGYVAFLHGRRVTYFGRQGDQHTEWFPGAAPAASTP